MGVGVRVVKVAMSNNESVGLLINMKIYPTAGLLRNNYPVYPRTEHACMNNR